MPHYELMFIVRPEAEEEVVDATVNQIENLIRQEGGTVLDCEVLGRKRLAYEVKKHHEGIYVKINFQAPPASIARMKARMQISEDIILHMVVRTPTFIPTDDIENRESVERPIRETVETSEPVVSEDAPAETPTEAPTVEDAPETEATVAASIGTEPVQDLGEVEHPADEDRE